MVPQAVGSDLYLLANYLRKLTLAWDVQAATPGACPAFDTDFWHLSRF